MPNSVSPWHRLYCTSIGKANLEAKAVFPCSSFPTFKLVETSLERSFKLEWWYTIEVNTSHFFGTGLWRWGLYIKWVRNSFLSFNLFKCFRLRFVLERLIGAPYHDDSSMSCFVSFFFFLMVYNTAPFATVSRDVIFVCFDVVPAIETFYKCSYLRTLSIDNKSHVFNSNWTEIWIFSGEEEKG